MTGTMHVWEDGKGILTLAGDDIRGETIQLIAESFQQANKDPMLMVFPFPVTVVRESGPLEYVGVGEATE